MSNTNNPPGWFLATFSMCWRSESVNDLLGVGWELFGSFSPTAGFFAIKPFRSAEWKMFCMTERIFFNRETDGSIHSGSPAGLQTVHYAEVNFLLLG